MRDSFTRFCSSMAMTPGAGIHDDWRLWSGRVAPGGIVGLPDTQPFSGRPRHDSIPYALEVVCHDPRFTTVDVVEALTILERTRGQEPFRRG